MSIRIGDVAYLNGMEPVHVPPFTVPRFVVPVDAVIDARPGGIIFTKNRASVAWTEPAIVIPNRLHGAAINARGEAI